MAENNTKNTSAQKDKTTEFGKNLRSAWTSINAMQKMAHLFVTAVNNTEKATSTIPTSITHLFSSAKFVGKAANELLGPLGDIIDMINADKYIAERVWEMQGRPSSSDLLEGNNNKGTDIDHRASNAQSFKQDVNEEKMKTVIETLTLSFGEMAQGLNEVDFNGIFETIGYIVKGINVAVPGVDSDLFSKTRNAFTCLYDIIGAFSDVADVVSIGSKIEKTIWKEQNDETVDNTMKCNAPMRTVNNKTGNKILVGGGLKLEKYAGGGFVDRGELFIAREAGPELVGMIGNSAAVMNNEQIVDAVARGVASAIGSQRVNVNVDGKNLFDIIVNRNNAQVRQTGLSPLMG